MDDRTQDLFKKYGSDFFCNWTLFQVVNSEYMEYVSKTSGNISDYRDLRHFAFVTDESIFEVLYTYEPIVTVSND